MYIDVIGYSVLLHSQKWLNESYYYIKREGPGNVVWNHWVNVWVPREKVLDKELLDSAILFVDGDRQADKPPSQGDLFVQIGRFLRYSFINLRSPNLFLVQSLAWHMSISNSKTNGSTFAYAE